MIQKLEHCVRGTDYGCGGASFSEVIDKVNEVIDYINSLPEEKPSEDLLDVAKDALLLERAWLTLDGFGHEELAERLRDYAERKGLIWK
jgi:hypothetical protein